VSRTDSSRYPPSQLNAGLIHGHGRVSAGHSAGHGADRDWSDFQAWQKKPRHRDDGAIRRKGHMGIQHKTESALRH
jgi:hypothetical protein